MCFSIIRQLSGLRCLGPACNNQLVKCWPSIPPWFANGPNQGAWATPACNKQAHNFYLLCSHVLEKASPSIVFSVVPKTFMNFPREINKPVNQNLLIHRHIIEINTHPFYIGQTFHWVDFKPIAKISKPSSLVDLLEVVRSWGVSISSGEICKPSTVSIFWTGSF